MLVTGESQTYQDLAKTLQIAALDGNIESLARTFYGKNYTNMGKIDIDCKYSVCSSLLESIYTIVRV